MFKRLDYTYISLFFPILPVGYGRQCGDRPAGRGDKIEIDRHHLGIFLRSIHNRIPAGGCPEEQGAARRVIDAVVQFNPRAAREKIN